MVTLLLLRRLGADQRLEVVRERRVFMDNSSVSRPPRSGFHFPRFDARMHEGDEVQIESIHTTWLRVSRHPSLTMQGRTVALRAASGKFCAVQLTEATGLIRCDQDTPPFAAWFEVSHGSNNISLRSVRGGDYCVDQPLGVRCDRKSVSAWEVFRIHDAGNGRIALRGGREDSFCWDAGKGLVCNLRELRNEATFSPVTDTPLISRIVQTKDPNEASVFVVHHHNLDEPTVALRCKENGFYVTVARGFLACSSEIPWQIRYARASWWDVKTATFRAPNSGLYFEAGDPKDGNHVTVNNKDGTGWALWRVQLLGGFEPLRPLVRGVNLGNWFLMERWMAQELFYDESGSRAFPGKCDAMDEYGLMDALGPEAAAKRMERHWSTWIKEEDIAWLSAHGINTVRVPFGYWMVYPEKPFVNGQLHYLDRLFEWCHKHSVAVLLDFHGLKGSQTGNPTSGNCGACGNAACGKTKVDFLEHSDLNLKVIDFLTTRFSNSPVYLGFAVANEVSSTANSREVMAFYQKAYAIVRKKSKDALVVLFATFNPSTYPFPNFKNVVEDIHIYFGMGFGHPSLDQQENLDRARRAVAGLHWHVLVGEWSLGANGHNTLHWQPEQREKFFATFAKMQLQAWETHSIGWFYWSYKTSFANSTWNFRDMCVVGWLPGCNSVLTYASTYWWQESACAYAYLDGGCPNRQAETWNELVVRPAQSVLRPEAAPWILLAALCCGAAGALVGFCRPAWATKCATNAGTAATSATDALMQALTPLLGATGWLPRPTGFQHVRSRDREGVVARVPVAAAAACGNRQYPREALTPSATSESSFINGDTVLCSPGAPAGPGNGPSLRAADNMEQPFIW